MHMYTILPHIDNYLKDFLPENTTDTNIKAFLKKHNITCGVDYPFIIKYKQFMRIFPNAKVVLTVRDAEAWVKSMKETLCKINGKNSVYDVFPSYFIYWIFPALHRLHQFIDKDPFFAGMLSEIESGNGVEFYHQWVKEVRAEVPSDRLLVFTVKEGWEPLCKFLKVPVPNEPFPRVNDTGEIQRFIFMVKIFGWVFFALMIIIPIAIAYLMMQYLV